MSTHDEESTPRRHSIAVIGGDGVGPEVIEAGIAVLEAAAARSGGFSLAFERLPWGSDLYLRTGSMMPADALDQLRGFDAIYLGAVGSPQVPDHLTLWGLLLPIRQVFDLYVNLRPVRLFPGLRSPLRLADGATIDMLCVRENTEGEYCGVGGRVHDGLAAAVAIQTDVFTRSGTERIVRHAFELALSRRRSLTSVTKSNAGRHAFVFWDEIVNEVSRDYPGVDVTRVLVDAAAAYFVTRPETFDVVVGSNLFMDILTDLGAAIQGGLGLAASANINPQGGVPGLFEPVHGSAPDIAGRGIANPVGAVWAGAMMLEHLGEASAAARVMGAIESVLAGGTVRTPDLGGQAQCRDLAEALIDAIREP